MVRASPAQCLSTSDAFAVSPDTYAFHFARYGADGVNTHINGADVHVPPVTAPLDVLEAAVEPSPHDPAEGGPALMAEDDSGTADLVPSRTWRNYIYWDFITPHATIHADAAEENPEWVRRSDITCLTAHTSHATPALWSGRACAGGRCGEAAPAAAAAGDAHRAQARPHALLCGGVRRKQAPTAHLQRRRHTRVVCLQSHPTRLQNAALLHAFTSMT
jgi:hypothetical protein